MLAKFRSPFLLLALLALPFSARADECASALRVFLGSSSPSSVDAAWLSDQLAKAPFSTGALNDLLDSPPASFAKLGKVKVEASASLRRESIAGLPLGDLMVAPGHRMLRKPQQIAALKKVILEGKGNFAHDPVLLNIVTDAEGRVKGVDIWNAHHRLVAYVEAGYATVGDIPVENLRVLVNGQPNPAEKWGHMLPAAGLDLEALRGQYRVAGPNEGADPGTVVLDGARSNFELGSRLTLGHLTKTMRERRPPKVAVFFGTFDPVHEGHIDVARRAAEEFGLDEVLLVPNAKPLHKPGVTSLQHRVRMTAIRVSSESKLNAYVGDSSPWVDGFGKDVFFKHVEQIYGTKDLYEIYGGDSFEKLMGLGQLKTDGPKYILFKREMTPGFTIPEHLRPHVLVSDADLPARSSTQVRNAFKSGQTPPASLMRPEISSYIQQNGLYGAPAQ